MTRPPLPTRTMERLAFARALFEQGVHQSMQLEPWAAASVLSFQDAIELFLVLSADHLGQSLERNDSFYVYFRKVNAALRARDTSLSESRAMERVNGVRVNLKHNGHMPGGIELRQAREDTAVFLSRNTPIIFGIEFDEIDLLTLVPQDTIREHIKEASRMAEISELESAMITLTRAFRELLTSHLPFPGHFFENRKQLSGFWWDVEGISGNPGLEYLAQQVAGLEAQANVLQRGLQVVSLGINYSEYVRFVRLTPELAFLPNGKFLMFTKEYSPSRTDFDYCRHFVVSTAIRVGQLTEQER